MFVSSAQTGRGSRIPGTTFPSRCISIRATTAFRPPNCAAAFTKRRRRTGDPDKMACREEGAGRVDPVVQFRLRFLPSPLDMRSTTQYGVSHLVFNPQHAPAASRNSTNGVDNLLARFRL